MQTERNSAPRPELVMSRSQFFADPHGVLRAVSSILDENARPAHISYMHNNYSARAIMVAMFLSLFLFAFVDAKSVFLGLAYLVAGLFSLAIQHCLGLVSRLDDSCGDNRVHIRIVQFFYTVGFLLWLSVPCYFIGKSDDFSRFKNDMLSGEYLLLHFIAFIAGSMALGFLIIMPASIINEVIMLAKTLFCCTSSYGALEPQNTAPEPAVELSSRKGSAPASTNELDLPPPAELAAANPLVQSSPRTAHPRIESL